MAKFKSGDLSEAIKAIEEQFQNSHFVDLQFVENLKMDQEYAQMLQSIFEVETEGFVKD